jgi:hypothetical protein
MTLMKRLPPGAPGRFVEIFFASSAARFATRMRANAAQKTTAR